MSDEMERDENRADVTADVTLPAENPPKRRAGGQPGNTNSTIHGARSRRYGLALGAFGKRHANIRQQVLRYRKRLLSEIVAARGSVSQTDEEYIIAAATYEAARRIVQKDLDAEGITLADRLSCLKQIANYTTLRLQVVAKLKLAGSDGSQSADDPASIYQSDPSDPA